MTPTGQSIPASNIVYAWGEQPAFAPGMPVRIASRAPLGHYRVPIYLRGKRGRVEAVLKPVAVSNEEEGFGRDAGMKRHYYRVMVPMTELWERYLGSPQDALVIEVFESWIEVAEP